MRDCSSQLAAAIADDATTLCRLWRVTRSDGTVLRFTDATNPVQIEVAPDTAAETYRADLSFTASSIFQSLSMANLQSVTLTFIMDKDTDETALVEKDIRARLYDNASSEVFVCDYAHPEYGVVSMFEGVFSTITMSDQKIATVTLTPKSSGIAGHAIGLEKYSQTCRASLGDARCKIDLSTLKVPFTVTGTGATAGVLVSTAFTQANDRWNLGFIKWLTGQNVGKTSQVQSNDEASNSVFLLSPPFFPIAVGDTGEIYPGCDKTRTTCVQVYNNMVNMRAEPDVPTGAGIPGTNYLSTNSLRAPSAAST